MILSEKTIRDKAFCFLENSIAAENYLYLFTSPVEEIVIHDHDKAAILFQQITKNQAKGLFAVGYCSYGCDIGQYKFKQEKSVSPMAHFVFYKNKIKLNDSKILELFDELKAYETNVDSTVHDISFNLSFDEYELGFDKIQRHLYDGDSYQVNYTGQYKFKLQGSSFDLYEKLRKQQLVSYGAYLPFSSGHILSFSPELFFTKIGNSIKTRPMKGTVKRSLLAEEDENQKNFLRNDVKNQSENQIIVDLLRNDLSRIAEKGSVKVNKLFNIETYESVHQMTSEIEAKVHPGISIEQIFKALFPCGSITGAPKKKTMEIINSIEKSQRGLYTGCIGYITPENDMSFSVAIRTLQLNQYDEGILGVGGGITTRSTCMSEWQEMHLKGQFFYNAPKNFKLIETLLFDNGYVFFDEHVERLSASCECFGFQFNKDKIRRILLDLAQKFNFKCKVRLLYDQQGESQLSHEIIEESSNTLRLPIVLSRDIVNSKNIMLRHKTTSNSVRGLFNKEYQLALNRNAHDAFFQNEKGHITESTRYNIIYRKDGNLYTPPVTDGLLPGIYRQNLIKQGKLTERSVSLAEIQNVDAIFICNSVRGILPAKIINEI